MTNREEERTFYENGVASSLCGERKFNTYKALNSCYLWPEFKRQAEGGELNSPRSCNLTGLFNL